MTGFGGLPGLPVWSGASWGAHLGSRLDALVDGQLPHDERDRVLAHVARCPACHDALMEARAVKAALARLADADVPGDLTSRLLALAGPDPGARPGSGATGTTPGGRPSGPGDGSRRRSGAALSVLGLAVGAAVLASAPSLTSSDSPAPRPAQPTPVEGSTVGIGGAAVTTRGTLSRGVTRTRRQSPGTAATPGYVGQVPLSPPPVFQPRVLSAELRITVR